MAGFQDNWSQVSSGFDDKTYMSDIVDIINKTTIKKFQSFRFIGNVSVYKQIWVPIFKDGKPIMGKQNRQMQIPKLVTNFDIKTQKMSEEIQCPYVELMEKMNKLLDDKNQMRISSVFVANCIDRDVQENLPAKIAPPSKEERKTGFRDMDSKHKNPVRVFAFSATEFNKVKGTMELNTVKLKSGEKVVKSLADPKYGYDISIKYDAADKIPTNKLKIQKGDRTPLTEEELEYLTWDLESAIATQIDDIKTAKKEALRLYAEFEKSLKKKRRVENDDENEEEPEDLEDEPVKKKAKKRVIEDNDEDEEYTPKKKKKPVDDDEDDEPVKKKAKRKVEDDDDDEVPLKKKKLKARPLYEDDEVKSKKKKKPVEEEEDNDDDLDDLDLDSDEDDDD